MSEQWRTDLRALLDRFPATAQPLLDAVRAGRIQGGLYWDEPIKSPYMSEERFAELWPDPTVGPCGCILGTAAHALGISTDALEEAVLDQLESEELPGQFGLAFEDYVYKVRPGMTPLTNERLARLELEIVEWQTQHAANLAQSLAHQQAVAVELFIGDRLPEETL